jgi:hypothetical protein
MAFDYTAWLKTAEDRLSLLKRERAVLDEEIAKLETGLRAFAPLSDGASARAKGSVKENLTEAVRRIFVDCPNTALAPTGIREDLRLRGFVLDQENPLAVIHQILARLKEKKFIEPVDYQGKTYYRLVKNALPETPMLAARLAEQLGDVDLTAMVGKTGDVLISPPATESLNSKIAKQMLAAKRRK